MRDYSKVEPKMWHGNTFKALRKSPEGLVVALYLMTSPQSNMIGLFIQPVLYMAHETGLGLKGTTKGLAKCIDAGFCAYDEESEFVWVYEMAKYQIAPSLKEKDLRVKGVQREYDNLPENPFLAEFFDRYSEAFLITGKRGFPLPLIGATKAPTKPLPSQEQEQEQEQEQAQDQEQDQEQDSSAAVADATTPAAAKPIKPRPKAKTAKPAEPAPSSATWQAYADAYEAKYGAVPVRNAAVNGQLAQIVARLGGTEAPQVAAFFLGHRNVLYVRAMHPVALLLRDAEKLRTEWATGQQVTHTQATMADRTQTNANAFGPLLAEARAKEQAHGVR